MPINFRHAQALLYNHLSKKKVTSLSLSTLLGQIPNFNRQAFYKQYQSKANFLGICINAKIRDEIALYNYKGIRENFYLLLHHIKREEIFYTNIFSLAKKDCICEQLQNNLHEFVIEKAKPIFSEAILKKETDAIYKRIYHWVSHGCFEEVKQIYSELETSMAHVEFLCDSVPRNSELIINFQNKHWGYPEKESN